NDGSHGIQLWKSDGTAAGTVLVSDIQLGAGGSWLRDLTNVSGTLYFSVGGSGTDGWELWKSDGTAAGTVVVTGIPGYSPGAMTNLNGTLVFSADNVTNGWELWKSDGTAAGTVLVKDINPGPDPSFPRNLTTVNGTLFFSALDWTNGDELWKSDGTPAE